MWIGNAGAFSLRGPRGIPQCLKPTIRGALSVLNKPLARIPQRDQGLELYTDNLKNGDWQAEGKTDQILGRDTRLPSAEPQIQRRTFDFRRTSWKAEKVSTQPASSCRSLLLAHGVLPTPIQGVSEQSNTVEIRGIMVLYICRTLAVGCGIILGLR